MELDFQELELISEHLDRGIVVCNKNGTIEFANEFAHQFYAFSPGELVGKKVIELSPSFSFDISNMKEDTAFLQEVSLKNKFGREVFFDAKIVRAKSRDRIIAIITDITPAVNHRNDLIHKINVSEKLTKSRYIREGHLDAAIHEIISESAEVLKVERVNAWIIDSHFSLIECIGNYTSSTNTNGELIRLHRKDMPSYFKLLETQEIIATDNTLEDPRTTELVDIYLSEHGITSMMDVPIRIEGEMIGVICFEHVGPPRKWTLTDRKFGLFMAQLISLSLETHEKQNVNNKLSKAVKEKDTLLAEIHHRVKNNLSIVGSLLNLQQNKAKDNFHSDLFRESRNRILTIASIHQTLYQQNNFSSIDLAVYIREIVNLITDSHSQKDVRVTIEVDEVQIATSKAVPIGLIVNEIVTNSLKHAFVSGQEKKKIDLYLRNREDKCLLEISDNGRGIDDIEKLKQEDTLGISLIYDLTEQINGTLEYSSKGGSFFDLYFDND